MKNKLILYLLFTTLSFPVFSQEDQNARAEFEYEMTKDPKTGLVPRSELEKSRGIMSQMLKLMAPVPNISWTERGPNNVGGRTRAIMWDPNDATKKKVWAGGVSGGLWYNTDITDANTGWTKINDFWDNIAIGWIAYDPSNTQIMYVGTGERSASGNTDNTGASGTGGNGIWKSTNGGNSWARLSSTTPDFVNANNMDAGWREIFKVIVNAQGHIYALNFHGVVKSTDGGATWAALTGTNAPAVDFQNPRIINDIEMGSDGILYIAEGGVNDPKLYKSTDNTVSAFTIITPPNANANGVGRVEIALAPSTNGATQVIYAVCASGSAPNIRFFKKSVDAGTTWTDMTVPKYDDLNNAGEKPFVGDQGDYDLILGTHETDANILYAAGVCMSISVDGGANWLPKIGYSAQGALMHVDHHSFAARPGFPNGAIFGNDGGVYYSANWGNSGATTYPTFVKRNKNYNVTQFFSIDINSVANSGTVIAGAQDNGTQTLTSPYGTVSGSFEINSGDGGLAFIDKVDSTIFISNYTNVTPKLNKAGPINGGAFEEMNPQFSNRGKFINPCDYDSPNHTLWHNNTLTSEADTKIIRYHITGASPNHAYTTSTITITGVGALDISFLKLGKTQGNLFLGTNTGDVYKVTGINVSGNQTLASITKIMDKATTATGNVSSLDFGTNENTIIVTKSNYNIKSVFYTTDGGANWVSKDEVGHGLTNIPIRYALINPVDTKQVLLATELGVWSTSDITATNPQWAPTNTALAHVRCDMLKFRTSDNTVAVATHGRGVFTTKLNQTSPCPTTLVLISTTDDKATGTTTFQATDSITASNKITGNANVTMRAGKSVELKPSTTGGGSTFEAANGTVFQAYIQGCTN